MSDFVWMAVYYIGVGMATLAGLTVLAIIVAAVIEGVKWVFDYRRKYDEEG
jgi:hypothetical protein